MKLSIIIPVYNGEKYIKECLNSILPSLDNNIEVLLLDDGSRDNSLSILQEYKQDNIRIFHHNNHGVSYTRNRGIKVAKGDYIMFVDIDDTLGFNWKEIIFNNIQNSYDVIYFSEKIKKAYPKNFVIDNIVGIKEVDLGNLATPWSKLFKKDFLLNNNISFDENLINGEDAILNLKVINSTDNYKFVDKEFYNYRVHEGSSTRNFNEKFFDSNLVYLQTLENILENSKRYIDYSVVYSVYLYLVLVNTIKGDKSIALNRLKEANFKIYLDKVEKSKDCSKIINIIYSLVRNNHINLAFNIIKIRKILKG